MRLFRKLGRRLGNLSTDFLRSDRFVISQGSIFVRSQAETKRISSLLSERWPQAGRGTAYIRLFEFGQTREISVLISGIGRFGNSIVQVNNAVAIALALQANCVLFFRYDAIQNVSVVLPASILMGPIRPLSSRPQNPQLICKTDGIFPEGILFDPCSTISQGVSSRLREALGIDLAPTRNLDNALTIHLRSGDVFSENPHSAYGQPPWAFYLRILKSRKWEEVVLVSEDTKNPNWTAIRDWCKLNSMTIRLAGGEFQQALKALLQARNLVLSRGTFASSAALLAPGKKRLYFFGTNPDSLICASSHEVFRVSDQSGEYTASVLSKNWKNTEAQLNLMKTFPLSKVSQPTLFTR